MRRACACGSGRRSGTPGDRVVRPVPDRRRRCADGRSRRRSTDERLDAGVHRLVDDPTVPQEHDPVRPAACRASCVTSRAPAPLSTCRRSIRRTTSPVCESSAPVGSSASTSRRSPTTPRAIATRCCWPPDRSSGKAVARWDSSTFSSASSAARRALLAFQPSSSSGSATFSTAVSDGIRLKSWKTNPIIRRRSADSSRDGRSETHSPSILTSPEVGGSRVPAQARSVDLPEPDVPMTATISPRATRRSTPARAVTALAPPPYWTLTASSSRSGAVIVPAPRCAPMRRP